MLNVTVIEGTGYDHTKPFPLMHRSFIESTSKSEVANMALARQLILYGVDEDILTMANFWVAGGDHFLLGMKVGDTLYISKGVGRHAKIDGGLLYDLLVSSNHLIWGALTDEDKEFILEVI